VLAAATVWVRPRSTDGRAAGVLIDAERKLVLTSAAAVGSEPVVELVAPRRYLGLIVSERHAYRDLLGLRLGGTCLSGVVLAHDPDRDLALVELDAVPEDLKPAALAPTAPRTGEPVATMSHPTGIDLLWLFAGGTVRAVGSVAVGRDSGESPRVRAALLQLPHQDEASGGPVVNAAGELVGVVAARGAARQDVAYAAVPEEIRAFLKTAGPMFEPKTAAEWTSRGRYLLRRNRLPAALDAFGKASELAPNDAAAAAGRASVLAAAGRRADAVRAAETALSRKPGSAILAEMAGIFMQTGERNRAAESVDRALKLDPRNAGALAVRARLRSGAGAIEDVAVAIDIDPGLADAYRVRAGLHDATDNEGRRQAIADWGRVLELSLTDLEALRERAQLFVAVREPKKAVGDWSRVTELEPLRAGNWIGLARARFAAGDRPGAADALRSALRVDASRVAEVFEIVREMARQLEEDNPGDTERVAEWRSTSLTRLAAWLPK
jgi:tetratricopeptide (TPR) repeat protein